MIVNRSKQLDLEKFLPADLWAAVTYLKFWIHVCFYLWLVISAVTELLYIVAFTASQIGDMETSPNAHVHWKQCQIVCFLENVTERAEKYDRLTVVHQRVLIQKDFADIIEALHNINGNSVLDDCINVDG